VDKGRVVNRDLGNLTEFSGQCLPGSRSEQVRTEPAFADSWKQRAQRLQKEAQVFYFVFKHPRTRWYARLTAACAAGYLLSPVQLIPNFIPVIGCLDDLLVLFVGVKAVQRLTPADVLAECRELADAAETRRNEEIRSTAGLVASVVVVTAWFLVSVTATALIAAYISH
jgi:uncharacterized membrane protein YkvA (DUF1232 family)